MILIGRIFRQSRAYWAAHENDLQKTLPLTSLSTIQAAIATLPDSSRYPQVVSHCESCHSEVLSLEFDIQNNASDETIEFAYDYLKALISRDDLRKDKIEQKATSFIAQSALIISASAFFFGVFGDKISNSMAPHWIATASIFLFIFMVASFAVSVLLATIAHKAAGIARIQAGIILTALKSGKIETKKEALKKEYLAYFQNAHTIHGKAKALSNASIAYMAGLIATFFMLSAIAVMAKYPKQPAGPQRVIIENACDSFPINFRIQHDTVVSTKRDTIRIIRRVNAKKNCCCDLMQQLLNATTKTPNTNPPQNEK